MEPRTVWRDALCWHEKNRLDLKVVSSSFMRVSYKGPFLELALTTMNKLTHEKTNDFA